VTAEYLAIGLGGRRRGSGWTARCPAHDDNNPSLSISERSGKILVHCFAGCDQEDVIDAL
jgi:DNA primase